MIQESFLPDEASYPGTPGVTDIEAQADVRDLPQLEDTDLQAAESAPAPPFMPIPFDMPLPDERNAPSPPDDDDPLQGSDLRRPVGDRRTPESEQASSPTSTTASLQERPSVEELILIGSHAAAPIQEASFSAADYTGINPPDVGGAAGPNHLVVVHNNVMRIQNKAGGALRTVSLSSFWSAVGGGGGPFSPRVLFDISTGRWIMTAGDDAQLPSSGILIGVSQTDDPGGSWNLRKVTIGAADSAWADHPTVGVNRFWVTVQANMFVGVTYARSHIYVFDKASLLAGGSGGFTLFTLPASEGGGQVPAVGFPSNPKTMYLLQSWVGNWLGTGFLRLWRLSRSGVSWDSNFPAFADSGPQLDSAAKVDLGDARLESVVCLLGATPDEDYLYAAHTVFLPAGAPTHTAIQFWGVRSNFQVNHHARIEDTDTTTGHAQTFYAFPSLAVTVLHSVLIGFATFSAQTYPGASWAFRWGSDPQDTLEMGGVLRSGEGAYVNVGFGTKNYWGYYTSTCQDPDGRPQIWTIQEYARPPQGTGDQSGRWGTWWGKFHLFEIG
jgi:hypothetical protein